jgi:hypothetical protein
MSSISKKLVLLVAALLWLADCRTFGTFSMDSLAPPHPIVIDGKTDDWSGNLFVEGEGLEVGFFNDRDDLYLCLLTRDDFTRAEILTQGLTVWFDPRGGTDHVFGIRFPLGLPRGEQKLPMRETREGPELENVPQKIPMEKMEILRSKEPPRTLALDEAKGIEVKVLPTAETVVYELKIPLASSEQHPFAVGSEPGKTIGVGFESAPLETKELPRKKADQRRPGDEGGERGEPGEQGEAGEAREGGRGGFGRTPQVQEPLKLWAFVSLTRD